MKKTKMRPVEAWAVMNPDGSIYLSTIRVEKSDSGYAYNFTSTLGAKAKRQGIRFVRVRIEEAPSNAAAMKRGASK